MARVRPRRLDERRPPDGGVVCVQRDADVCVPGAVRPLCRDIRPPPEQAETHQIQPGRKGRCFVYCFFLFFTRFILACIWYLFCCLKSVKSVLTFVSSSPSSPQVASLIGSSSVLFCGLLSQNMDDFPSFQGFTVLVAVLACGCMIYTGLHSKSRFDTKGSAPGSNYQGSGQSTLSFSLVTSMTLQILTNRNFQLFVLMNFFQVRK